MIISNQCYKTFLIGNLDLPKIKESKNVCSDVWTWTKMWKQWIPFLTKTILLNCLLLKKLPIIASSV